MDENKVSEILKNCIQLAPGLKKSRIIDTYAGLRPGRHQIRLEKEADKNIIHNYGHGGSGFTVSWGCAEEVFQLVNNL